jgi:hypothetical protein
MSIRDAAYRDGAIRTLIRWDRRGKRVCRRETSYVSIALPNSRKKVELEHEQHKYAQARGFTGTF